MFERALAIRERALGPDHPDTAVTLNNFARLLQAEGDLAGARPLFERALAIGEKSLGPEHSLTSRFRSHYARLLLASGDFAAAQAQSEAALASDGKALGPTRPWTADSARVAVEALTQLRRIKEADAVRAHYLADEAPS